MKTEPKIDIRLALTATVSLVAIFSVQNWAQSNDGSFTLSLVRQTVVWGLWLVMLPLVLRSARKRPVVDTPRGPWIASLFWVGLSFAAVHGALSGLVRWTIGIAAYPDLIDAMLANVLAQMGRNFITYVMIVAAYQAILYHHAVRERDQRAARLEIDLSAARLDSLEGRLRPHFLFNTLNAIAALIREDPAKAERLVGQLSDLLRASLRADPARTVALSEELMLVGQYLEIERTRFEDRLTTSIDATEEARAALVPHLILQPLVENAIRHGIGPRGAAGRVTVGAARVDDRLQIVVEDNGVGMGNSPDDLKGSGIGLGGVRSRLAFLYGAAQRVDVSQVIPTGTRVLLEIPFDVRPERGEDTAGAGFSSRATTPSAQAPQAT
jgi:two-component system, LytTR family, sensor kinase